MARHNTTVYVAFGRKVWGIPNLEFKHFLQARCKGVKTDEGDLERMGQLLRMTFKKGGKNGGFSRMTKIHPRFNITGWTPADYKACMDAENTGTLLAFSQSLENQDEAKATTE